MSWKLVFNTFVTLAFVAAVLAWQYPELVWPFKPCAEPITYTIGDFDKRFNISQKDFLSALAEAETVWEKPLGKELFAYSPEKSELAVNLIYDYRQETTKTLSGLESTVKQDEVTYDALQARYKQLKAEYENAKSVYDARVAAFEKENDIYQAQVEAWNRSRRNSKTQFEQLEAVREALEAEVAELKVVETNLNEIVREINNLVGTLNSLAKTLNLSVENYNTIGASRGESFTGGLYHSADGTQGIDIYEFSSREKLIRTLAHELGHALGLEHVDDPKAIMYYLNQSNTKVPTQADLVALKTLCGAK